MITIQIRDNCHLHGYVLWPGWLGWFSDAVLHAKQALPNLPVTMQWVLPRGLPWRFVGEGNNTKAVSDSLLPPEAAAIWQSHRLAFCVLQIPSQTGYLWEPEEKPWKHWLALIVLCKQDKQSFLGDSGERNGTVLLLVPHCHLENRHKEEWVGDPAIKEGHPVCTSWI